MHAGSVFYEIAYTINSLRQSVDDKLCSIENNLYSIEKKLEYVWMERALSAALEDTGARGVSKTEFVLWNCINIGWANLGNEIQSIAVRRAIESRFPDASFEYCEFDNVAYYRSPPDPAGHAAKIFVMNGWYSFLPSAIPSRDLAPVFIGMHLNEMMGQRTVLELLSRAPGWFSEGKPLGCRDKFTLWFCRERDIPAYLSRCNTLTFPRRKSVPKNGKVFINAIPEEFLKYIPKSILENAEIIRQDVPPVPPSGAMRMAQDLLDRYEKEAGLIITSKIHSASPATALGVPVVMINWKDEQWGRSSFLEDIIPIYSLEDLAQGRVDWRPEAPDIEGLKKLMLENLRLSILDAQGEEVDLDRLADIRLKIENFKA
jgi:hypothetical protein